MGNIIKLEGTFNTRDFGDCRTTENSWVKKGLFYRSDALHQISEKDQMKIKEIGIKTIVDFRNTQEQAVAPDILLEGVNYISLSPNADIAALGSGSIVDDKDKIDTLLRQAKTEEGRLILASKVDEMEDQMRELVYDTFSNQQYEKYLNLFLDCNNVPLLHHCKGGKDRTGLASILLLLALGVDKEAIIDDYMTTKSCMENRNVKRMNEYRAYTSDSYILNYLSGLMQTKLRYIEAVFDEMEKLSGTCENYLAERLHFDEEKCKQLRKMYTEVK